MTVVFSHETALERLRSAPPQIKYLNVVEGRVPTAAARTNYREARTLDPSLYGISASPLHVLVPKGAKASSSASLKSHEFGLHSLPTDALHMLDDGVYTCSPELVFAQLALTQPLVDSVCLGLELCGSYSHFAAPISGFYDRPPVTSRTLIQRALDELEGLYGLFHAQDALDRVVDGSRSPMETVTVCELTFPISEGGYGFAKPQLNHRVELDEAARRLAGSSHCFIDLAWPEVGMGVEYNGREFHKDPARDRKRIEALEHMGWLITTIEAGDLGDPRKLEAIAGVLAKRVPIAEGAGQRPSYSSRQALHRELLRATRCGLGLENALFGIPVEHGRINYHVS